MAITDFLTCWSLIISYSVFIAIIFFNKLVPVYIFLSAACLLSSTSIIGTLFITGPLMSVEPDPKNKLIIFAKDILVHIGPFFLFLLLFKYLTSRINLSEIKQHKEIPPKFFIISVIILLIIGLSYAGIIKPITNDIYKAKSYTHTYCSIILLICVYCSIYQIYFTQIKSINK